MRFPAMNTRALTAVLVLVAALAGAGCNNSPEPRMITGPAGEGSITQLDVDGHSLAYGAGADKDGPNGTGFAPQVSQELGLKNNNNAFTGATLQESGVGTDGWGKVLRSHPRPARGGRAAARALPNMALLWYGANDLLLYGDDMSRARETFRTIISRHRASAVYEAGSLNDASIRADEVWEPTRADAGQASGESFLRTTRPGTVTIDVPKGTLAEGAVLDLGFVQLKDTTAHYTIEVDGQEVGQVDSKGPLKPDAVGYLPEYTYTSSVYRIEGLGPERHRIEVVADKVKGEAGFDYWQVEPPVPEPVVLLKQYRLPGKVGIEGFSRTVRPDDIAVINDLVDELAEEYGDRMLTVDTEKVIRGDRGLIAPDEIHLNQRGYDLVADQVVQAIRDSDFADELPASSSP